MRTRARTSNYRIDRPDERTRQIQQMILVQQFTYIGAPHIWNGDEVGMWGADDPDPRKPLVWADLRYEDETTHPYGRPRPRNRVAPDTVLLPGLHRSHRVAQTTPSSLRRRALNWLQTDDAKGLVAYERVLGDQRALVAFNNSDEPRQLAVAADGTYRTAYPAGGTVTTEGGMLQVELPPRTARVWIRNQREPGQ